MTKHTDITLKEVTCSTQRIDYRTPIKFGGRVVVDVVLFNVEVLVESRDGRQARGQGSMPLGNVWSWPSQEVSGDQTLQAMETMGQELISLAADFHDFG